MLSRAGDLLAVPGAGYALALPALVLAVCLDYGNNPHNAGWTHYVYLWLTFAGFVVASHEGLQAGIERVRWLSLALGLVSIGASLFLLTLEAGPAFGTWQNALGWGCRALGSWCLVLAILGFGRRHLNFASARLKYANEAVLPFYILHQTVLLAVGYFVVEWTMPALLKWGIILLVSFPIVMLLYEFLVRRYNVMRFLFGMKSLPKAPTAQPAGTPRVLPSA